MHGIKTILLPFNNIQPSAVAVGVACQIASLFDSYIEGAYYRQLMPIIAGEGITLPGDYLAEFEEEGRAQARQAAQTFENLLQKRGIVSGKIDDQALDRCGGWSEIVGTGPAGIGEYARLFDLSVVARTNRDATVDWKTTVEAILFESGRPLLVVGEEVPETIGRRILVAWNGSTESARSLTGAMPFLVRCEKAAVVEIEGGTVSGPGAEQMATHLAKHGIQIVAETVQRKGDENVGGAVLDYAESFQADLIVKGAFTQSRLRQLIFGGATREILQYAHLPVLFSH